jgi:hypothetical protein
VSPEVPDFAAELENRFLFFGRQHRTQPQAMKESRERLAGVADH